MEELADLLQTFHDEAEELLPFLLTVTSLGRVGGHCINICKWTTYNIAGIETIWTMISQDKNDEAGLL